MGNMFFEKSRSLLALCLVCITAALMACSPESKVVPTPTPDRSPVVRTNMEKYNQCFSQMNADCMAALFAANGGLYDTGLLQASGPEAIQGYLIQTFKAVRIDSLTATVDSTVINGDVAVVRGTYQEKTTDPAGQSSETKLQFVAEWMAQSNDAWLLNRISTVPSPPTRTGTP